MMVDRRSAEASQQGDYSSTLRVVVLLLITCCFGVAPSALEVVPHWSIILILYFVPKRANQDHRDHGGVGVGGGGGCSCQDDDRASPLSFQCSKVTLSNNKNRSVVWPAKTLGRVIRTRGCLPADCRRRGYSHCERILVTFT
jgi:hypothetical protein